MGRGYQDLVAWQKSFALTLDLYKQTATWPKEEKFGLIAQVRNAAESIPSNIAEGQGRRLPKDFRRFVRMAYGSLMELETHLLIAHGLNYIDTPTKTELVNRTSELGRILNGLANSLTGD
jgi:four helix bundle protein